MNLVAASSGVFEEQLRRQHFIDENNKEVTRAHYSRRPIVGRMRLTIACVIVDANTDIVCEAFHWSG